VVKRADRDFIDETLGVWVDPERVFVALYAELPFSFWLDGGRNAVAGASYMGAPSDAAEIVFADAAGRELSILTPGGADAVEAHGSVFDHLRERVPAPRPDDPAPMGFRLGWVGWIGYEAGAAIVGSPFHPSSHPDAAFMFIDRVVVFDHVARTVVLRYLSAAEGVEEWVSDTRTRLLGLTPGEPDEPGPVSVSAPPRWRHDSTAYLALIERCQDAIRMGDAYLLCLTNQITLDPIADVVDAYRRLRRANPSPHGGLLRFGGISLLSSSPEQFLEVRADGRVTSSPIKGTRPRGATVAEDDALKRELRSSEKERAENVMIVDLVRNDLARACAVGSVEVTRLFAVESYRNVHQLVSTVEGRLAPGRSAVDVAETCGPAGSMTGAPKRSAMSILDAVEAAPRGPYAGCFGYLGLDGAADLAMTIRTIVSTPDRATIGTGGGITALSVPEEELDEIHLKAEPLLRAIGAVTRRPRGNENP
jgi:para-aminobenzoate synthetase component 1